jgi:hypothetical protein
LHHSDGHIDYDELNVGMHKLGIHALPAQVRAVMDECDGDRNGTLEFDEFVLAIKKVQDGSMQVQAASSSGGFFSRLFAKKEFDAEKYRKEEQERQNDILHIESDVLSSKARKKLEKIRRERAGTH